MLNATAAIAVGTALGISADQIRAALDSFGGGFVPQTFIAYLFTRKYGAQTVAARQAQAKATKDAAKPAAR